MYEKTTVKKNIITFGKLYLEGKEYEKKRESFKWYLSILSSHTCDHVCRKPLMLPATSLFFWFCHLHLLSKRSNPSLQIYKRKKRMNINWQNVTAKHKYVYHKLTKKAFHKGVMSIKGVYQIWNTETNTCICCKE